MKVRYVYALFLLFLALPLLGLLPLGTHSSSSSKDPILVTPIAPKPEQVTNRVIHTPAVYSVVPETFGASELATANWQNPGYITVEDTSSDPNSMQILPSCPYISNNASFSNPTDHIAINVSFELWSGHSPYGELVIAYGVNVEPYMYPPKFFPSDDGLAVVLEHASTDQERIIGYIEGYCVFNITTGDLSEDTKYTLGFTFNYETNPSTFTIYWDNGTAYSWTKEEPALSSNGNYFVIGASNGGTVYGYGQWVLYSYSIYDNEEVTPPLTLTLSYESTTLANGLQALTFYDGAFNPINVSTNASSWKVSPDVVTYNLSVTGSVNTEFGSLGILTSGNEIRVVAEGGVYPAPNTDSWYMNMTILIQLVTAESSSSVDVTIPVFIAGYAQEAEICYPSGAFLSGQIVSFTDTVVNSFPANEGYTLVSPMRVEVNIQGYTSGFVPIPYSFTPNVTVPTKFNFVISASEDGFSISSLTSSFSVDPVKNYPVIFAISPTSVPYGDTFTLEFQFTENGPISNISSFSDSAGLLSFSFMKTEASQISLIISLPQVKYGDLVFIPAKGNNIYVPLNGSDTITFQPGVNVLNLQIIGNSTDLAEGSESIGLCYDQPIIGIGLYNASMNWLYIDGAVVQNGYSGQSYVITIGQSLSTLTELTSGYVNATGWGEVKVPAEFTGYELVNIYWYGVRSETLNITVTPSTQTSTTSTNTNSNISCSTYNYTTPFSSPNNVSSTSTLYNFSKDQPWATLVGLLIIVLIALLGWKFGGVAGASGGGVAGIVMASYLGLVPWYLYFVVILVIAMLLGKIITDRFLGGGENG